MNLLDLTFSELQDLVAELGEPKFRAQQLWQWLWQKGVREFSAMTNLSKAFREKLGEAAYIGWPEVDTVRVSKDGTVKFLLTMPDGAAVETVLIPEKTHYTQCLSTQVGCAMGCTFCSTGKMGFKRNLSQAEILGQILAAREYVERENLDKALRNLVFMGMGEPLLNYDNLVRSLETLLSDTGLGFGTRRVTVSTAGIPGMMEKFGHTGLAKLAISLHAPTQELREKIMPKAAKMLPMDDLIAELKRFPLRTRERITIEYILLKDVNDSEAHARELVRLLSHLKVKVNLIVYNPSKGMPYGAPSQDRVLTFEKVLWDKNMSVIIRKSKGQDIEAACGQLVVEKMAN